jgi:hypothetical protein
MAYGRTLYNTPQYNTGTVLFVFREIMKESANFSIFQYICHFNIHENNILN